MREARPSLRAAFRACMVRAPLSILGSVLELTLESPLY